MRRLCIVLLQDLAVLQPRYPSLPFYTHTPFIGPEWEAFAMLVQAGGAATEPALTACPAVRELEETWGSRWRPGNMVRV